MSGDIVTRTAPDIAYALHPWAEVARRHIEGFPAPTVEDLIRAAPFAD